MDTLALPAGYSLSFGERVIEQDRTETSKMP